MTRIKDQFPNFVPPGLPEPDCETASNYGCHCDVYSDSLVEEYAEAYLTSFLAYLASSTHKGS